MSLLWRGVRLGVLDAAWLEKTFGLRLQRFTDHWEDQKVQAMLERADDKKVLQTLGAVKQTPQEAPLVEPGKAKAKRKVKKTVDKK